MMRVTVASDVGCPWCFIGYRNLRAAAPTVNARWLPYIVNPNVPEEGYDLGAYYQKHWGVPLMALKMPSNPLIKAAKAVGVEFNWNRRVVNSSKANALVALALEEGVDRQNQIMDALFTQYFFEAEDISNDEVLLNVAREFDLSRWRSIDSRFHEKVQEEAARNREHFKGGVPHFTLEKNDTVITLQAPSVEEIQEAIQTLG
eukprot:GEMP01039473.1.p1 GENE.GEMP01039473.1~~GEMP01039473.1.p1  ORF type:complete len:226 (+),score=47.49 GEMP01039473.1:75-680(+)